MDDHQLELINFLQNGDPGRPSQRNNYNACKFSWLKGYYTKRSVSQVSNAYRAQKVIDENNLHLLCLPKKYLYHVAGMASDKNDTHAMPLNLVVCEVLYKVCNAGYYRFSACIIQS